MTITLELLNDLVILSPAVKQTSHFFSKKQFSEISTKFSIKKNPGKKISKEKNSKKKFQEKKISKKISKKNFQKIFSKKENFQALLYF